MFRSLFWKINSSYSGTDIGLRRYGCIIANHAAEDNAMLEDPPIVKTTDEVRQGVRVKGMTTVLVTSIILATIGILTVIVFVVPR